MARLLSILCILLFSSISQAQDLHEINVSNIDELVIFQIISFDKNLFPDIAFDNTGQQLVVINVGGAPDFDNTTTMFRFMDSSFSSEFKHEIPIAQTVTFTPNNDEYLIGTKGELSFFDSETHNLIRNLVVDTSAINRMDFSPDADLLAVSIGCLGCGSIPNENNLVVLSTEEFDEVYNISSDYDNNSRGDSVGMDYSDDGRFIAYGTTNGEVHILETENWVEIETLNRMWGQAPKIVFHTETQTLTYITGDGIQIWDIAPLYRGQAIQDYRLLVQHETGQGESIQHFDLSSDGSLLVAGHVDGLISFWDVETATEIVSFEAHNRVTNVEFSPDNTLLVSTGVDGDLIVWHIPTIEE